MFTSKRLDEIRSEVTSLRRSIDQVNATIQTLFELQASQVMNSLAEAASELNYLQARLNIVGIKDTSKAAMVEDRQPQEFNSGSRQ